MKLQLILNMLHNNIAALRIDSVNINHVHVNENEHIRPIYLEYYRHCTNQNRDQHNYFMLFHYYDYPYFAHEGKPILSIHTKLTNYNLLPNLSLLSLYNILLLFAWHGSVGNFSTLHLIITMLMIEFRDHMQ